jgi:hypothetical protein
MHWLLTRARPISEVRSGKTLCTAQLEPFGAARTEYPFGRQNVGGEHECAVEQGNTHGMECAGASKAAGGCPVS